MFEDISLYSLLEKSSYSDLLSDDFTLINYGYDISCKIESEEFQNFINNYSSGVISRLHSKIIIPVDTILTKFSNTGFKVDLDLISNIFNEDDYSTSSIYGAGLDLSYGHGFAEKYHPNLEIPIGDLIQYHVNNNLAFKGFTLKNNSQSNNFSPLYLKNNNAYIYMVVQK